MSVNMSEVRKDGRDEHKGMKQAAGLHHPQTHLLNVFFSEQSTDFCPVYLNREYASCSLMTQNTQGNPGSFFNWGLTLVQNFIFYHKTKTNFVTCFVDS